MTGEEKRLDETEKEIDMDTKDESSQHGDEDKVMKVCKDDLEDNLLYTDIDGVNLTTTNDQEDSLNTEMEAEPEDTSVMETGNYTREINLDICEMIQSKGCIENIEMEKNNETAEGVMENEETETNVKMVESEENKRVEDQNKNKNTGDIGLKTTEVESITEENIAVTVTDEKNDTEKKMKENTKKRETEKEIDMDTKDESSQHGDEDKVMKVCKDDLEDNLLYTDIDGVNLTTTNDQEDSLNTEMEAEPEDTSVMETGNYTREINLDICEMIQSKGCIENIEMEKNNETAEGVMENEETETNVKMVESEENKRVEDQNKNKNTGDIGLKTTEVESITEENIAVTVTDEKNDTEKKMKENTKKRETEKEIDMDTKDESSQHGDEDKVMKVCKDDLEDNLLYTDIDGVNLTTTNDQEDSLNTEMEAEPEDTSVMETGNYTREINLDICEMIQSKGCIENIEMEKNNETAEGVMENEETETNVKMVESEENKRVEDQNKNKNTGDIGLKTTEVESITEENIAVTVTDEKNDTEKKMKENTKKRETEKEIDMDTKDESSQHGDEDKVMKVCKDDLEDNLLYTDIDGVNLTTTNDQEDSLNTEMEAEPEDTSVMETGNYTREINLDICEMIQSKGCIENIEMEKNNETAEGVMENEETETNVKMVESEENKRVEDQNKNKNTGDIGLKTTEVESITEENIAVTVTDEKNDTEKKMKENTKKCFLSTGLNVPQLKELQKLAVLNQCQFCTKFDKDVTHVIVKTDPIGSGICDRTLKFFLGLSQKCWILDYQWVIASRGAGHLLPEDPFEIKGDTVTEQLHSGPKRARLNTSGPLFDNMQFLVIGKSKDLQKDDLKSLLVSCGGHVKYESKDIIDKQGSLLITCSDEEPSPDELKLFKEYYDHHGMISVSREWALDCLTVYKLLPVSDYVLTPKTEKEIDMDTKDESSQHGDEDKVMKVCKDDLEDNLLYTDIDGVNLTTTNDQEDSLNTEMEAEPEDTSVMETGNYTREINLDICEMIQSKGCIENIEMEKNNETAEGVMENEETETNVKMVESEENKRVEDQNKNKNTGDIGLKTTEVKSITEENIAVTVTDEKNDTEKKMKENTKKRAVQDSAREFNITPEVCDRTCMSTYKDGGSPVVEFVIECSKNGEDWIPVEKVDKYSNAFKVKELEDGKQYSFRVSALNNAGQNKTLTSEFVEIEKAPSTQIFRAEEKVMQNQKTVEPNLNMCIAEPQATPETDLKMDSQIQLVNSANERNGKHDYTKTHSCIFCGKLDLKISRHLEKKHSDEKVIAQLPKASKNRQSKDQNKRKCTLDTLRNEGDFIFNIEVLQNVRQQRPAQQLIVARRPSEGQHQINDYLPCKYCLRFYIKTELWRHGSSCTSRRGNENLEDQVQEKSFIKAGKRLLQGAGISIDHHDPLEKRQDYFTYILESLSNDVIGQKVKNDQSILVLGKSLFDKLGRERSAGIRYSLRLLARIKTEVLLLKPVGDTAGDDLVNFLRPENFNLFVAAVKTIVKVSEEKTLNGVDMFMKPELAKKAGQIIRKLSEHHLGAMVTQRNREGREDIADFLFLIETQWTDKIGSQAHQSSKERTFNKKEVLPLTQDIMKLATHQNAKIPEKMKELSEEKTIVNWKELAYLVLSKIQAFNFRRGNETSKMQLIKYSNRADWRGGNEELYKSLSAVERELAKKMDLVEVIGKKNRKVPVLLTPLMKRGIDLLISTRDSSGVEKSNIFVFAKGERSYIEGAEALNHVLKEVEGLKHPENIRFPKMRKYFATTVQLFGIKEHELAEVARHMGHELAVHRQYYRLQDDVIELAKVSKLLLAVESGKANAFRGMSIDDIDIDGLPNVGDDEELERTFAQNDDADLTHTKSTDIILPSKAASAQNDDADLTHTKSTDIILPSKAASVTVKPIVTVRPKRRLDSKNYKEAFNFADSDEDPDFDIGRTMKKNKLSLESDSDSDSEPNVARKKSEKQTSKRKWTNEEKEALVILVNKAICEKKPPKKSEVQKLQKRYKCIACLKWLNVKHQIWAVAQQKMRSAKRLLGGE
ncbi:uncharacterized protein LOC134685111 isoform X2 [Mytilus trossulus]|uniref:uncharacterized protein LOC134685111 isoform X2 n=1 Tax=Mytilus trossulus TaxID=6551 RepID=UPI003004595E